MRPIVKFRTHSAKATALAACLSLALLSASCSEDQTGPEELQTDRLYAMMVQVYSLEDRTVYVSLSDTLDITSTNLETAREFPGVANFAAVDGRILISDGLQPRITEFEINEKSEWTQGRSVDFGQYPLEDNANFYYQFIIDSKNALLPYDGTKRIHWDPTEMVIRGSLEDTTLVSAEPPSLILEAGGNRNSVHYDQQPLQAFFYHDEDWYDYGSKSHIVAYNPKTFTESSIVEVPCPGTSLATRDEQGNTYFATWDMPTRSLKGERPAPCIAKLAPDLSLTTMDPRQWTSGRYVNNFRYTGNGKAVANVLHHEALGVDDPAKLDATQLENLWQSGPHWKLWQFDVNQKTGAPVAGIDVDIGSGAQFAVLDGRTFFFVPYQDWARTKIFEIGSDGQATLRVDTVGDVFKWVRVK